MEAPSVMKPSENFENSLGDVKNSSNTFNIALSDKFKVPTGPFKNSVIIGGSTEPFRRITADLLKNSPSMYKTTDTSSLITLPNPLNSITEPFQTSTAPTKTSSSVYKKSSLNPVVSVRPKLSNIQSSIKSTLKPFMVEASASLTSTKFPLVATMKPFSISLKLSVPTPPPAKTIQSSAIHTLEELPQGSTIKQEDKINLEINSKNEQNSISSNKNDNKQSYNEGDKSTLDFNTKNKQNIFLSKDKNRESGVVKDSLNNIVEGTVKRENFATPSTVKKASEKDLLNYIKSLVKEASLEKITETLG